MVSRWDRNAFSWKEALKATFMVREHAQDLPLLWAMWARCSSLRHDGAMETGGLGADAQLPESSEAVTGEGDVNCRLIPP